MELLADLNWLVIIRQVNLALGAFGIVLLARRMWHFRKTRLREPESRYFLLATMLYLVAAQIGTIEAWNAEFGWGWRIPIVMLAHMWFLYAVLASPPTPTLDEPPKNFVVIRLDDPDAPQESKLRDGT